jgi:hypothetical protein
MLTCITRHEQEKNKMTIPASFIVDVRPRVITGGSNDLEMNGLIFSRNARISAGSMVLEFGGAAAVGAYFGLDSEEYAAAQVYFAGYSNKFSAPRSFFVGLRVDAPVGGWMRTGPYSGTLEALKAVTNGAFVITIDGVTKTISGVNLSAATSFSAAASILSSVNDLDATVTYSSLDKTFTISSISAGAGHDVSFADSPASGTDLAALLNAKESLGAIRSPAMDALSVAQNMAAIRARSENWVTFTTLWAAPTDEMLEYAAFASANYGWLYVAHSQDPNIPSPDSSADPASALKASACEHSAIVYGAVDYALFIMGSIASISWLRVNGTITLAFKRQPGLAAYVTDESQAAALEAKNCNYFGNFATRNAEFVFLYNGCLSASRYGFIDPYINSVWLNNRLQVALMDGLTMSGRVPYNERGYAKIRAWMMDPIKAGLNNAAIEPGIALSEAQKSELFNEAGMDISGELSTQGYFIQIIDPGAPVRAQRQSPVVNLWYTYGGAVQKIEVASTAIL